MIFEGRKQIVNTFSLKIYVDLNKTVYFWRMNKIFYITTFLFILSFVGCSKENVSTNYQSGFTLSGSKHITPNAYIRNEGGVGDSVYYVSISFATGGVSHTNDNSMIGYGEAVKFYFYTSEKNRLPSGRYNFVTVFDTKDPYYKIRSIELFTNSNLGTFDFKYPTKQLGLLYNKAISGSMNVVKNGDNYDINYVANVGYSKVNGYQPAYLSGDYKGTLVFPK